MYSRPYHATATIRLIDCFIYAIIAFVVLQCYQNQYEYAYQRQGHRSAYTYHCVGKFFGDLFEKWVFRRFDEEQRREQRRDRRGKWYRTRSDRMREILVNVGVIKDVDFKTNITKVAIRIRQGQKPLNVSAAEYLVVVWPCLLQF